MWDSLVVFQIMMKVCHIQVWKANSYSVLVRKPYLHSIPIPAIVDSLIQGIEWWNMMSLIHGMMRTHLSFWSMALPNYLVGVVLRIVAVVSCGNRISVLLWCKKVKKKEKTGAYMQWCCGFITIPQFPFLDGCHQPCISGWKILHSGSLVSTYNVLFSGYSNLVKIFSQVTMDFWSSTQDMLQLVEAGHTRILV
jgi:hypothetical protein